MDPASAYALVGRLGPDGPPLTAGAAGRRWESGPLSVVAGSGGSGGTERTVCALEGRISNLAALAAALELPGTDAERVLATGYERWGEALVARCRGEFSLVLWDRSRATGLAARDPLGHRAVFLCARGPGLLFASEVRGLLAALATRPGPDRVAVAHWVHGTGVPEGRTLLTGVRRLAPGHLVRLGADGWSERRYWWPRRAVGIITVPAEAEATLREGLRAAVTRAMQPGPLGVLLSGGLDSGVVAAFAASAARETGAAAPHCYSGTFPALAEADESARIAAVRDHLGLDGTEARFVGGSALAPALAFLAAYDLPPLSPNALIWRPLVRHAAGDGTAVLLDGEGGDELFGCAPYLLADRLRAGRPDRALALARQLPGMGGAPRVRWLSRALLRFGVRGALPGNLHRRLRALRGADGQPAHPWLLGDLAALHAEHDPWAFKDRPGPRWRAGLLNVVLDGAEAIGAHDQFRREAALGGLEFRHPLRDPELLDVVLALDPSAAFDSRLDRPLVRRAVRGLVPDVVRLNTAKPHFNAPFTTALGGPDAAAVAHLLDPATALAGEFVDVEAVRRALDAPGPRALDLWRVLMLECWLRRQADPAAFEAWGERARVSSGAAPPLQLATRIDTHYS
ncbi:MAG: hypothetical protein H0V81_06755 [Solirubrobacterales bacterium]|nr:hypothetical protein [Solirubrobacterales bacterium]